MKAVDRLYAKLSYPLGIAAAFLLPLRLSLGYAALIPLLTLWVLKSLFHPPELKRIPGNVFQPLALFLIVAALTSLFGINPGRSFARIGSLIFFPLTVLVYYELSLDKRFLGIILALILGEAVSGTNAILEALFPGSVPRMLMGKISQSGQIALTIVTALGYVAYLGKNRFSYRESGIGFINFLLLTILAFWKHVQPNETFFWLVFALACLSLLVSISAPIVRTDRWKDGSSKLRMLATSVLLPLIATALLVNMKRGPWSGVLIGALIFLFFYARRLVLPIIVVAVSLILLVTPIRSRILLSSDHFFISGGRNVIWEIGSELSLKYPLGIGYENSGFMRQFSTDIPQHLKHFHNNFLNVLVETGWIGLALYLWWLVSTVRSSFRIEESNQYTALGHAIGCALIAWQVAGLVEYNFGDASVVTVAYLLIGVLLSIIARSRQVSTCAS